MSLIRPATAADATPLACFVDMASDGLALHLWATMKGPRQTLFEVGRSRAPPMPYSFFKNMTAEDLDAVVAYLRTIAPVKNEVARTKFQMKAFP